MSDETQQQPPATKRKIHPALIAGPFVGVGAALIAVIISTADNKGAAPQAVDAGPQADVAIQSADQPVTPPAPPIPGGATSVGALSYADDILVFSAAIPPGDEPVLSALRREMEAQLANWKKDARVAREAARTAGQPFRPWEVGIEWSVLARAGDLVSLQGRMEQYTGGAHPMQNTDTIIARASTGERLGLEGLLRPGLFPSPAIIIGVCENLKLLKKRAIGSATVYDQPIVCAGPNANVDIQQAKFALAPSVEPGRFGGLYAYFDPYVVGPYVEGPYTVTLQQEVFRLDLLPEFAPLFGGAAPVVQR